MGATPVHERVVTDGNVMTAAGVSAGIELAIHLAARLRGDETAQALQLAIEYEPEMPFSIFAADASARLRQAAADLINSPIPSRG